MPDLFTPAAWRQMASAAGFDLTDLDDEFDPEVDLPGAWASTVPAAGTTRPRQSYWAPVSVYDLARRPVRSLRLDQHHGQPTTVRNIEREGDVIRCTCIAIQDTEEWAEKEQARRARQRPPQPTKRFRFVSKKLRKLIVPDVEHA